MKYASYFKCDMCGHKFDKRDGVRNDVAILNGDESRVYGDVCDPCIKKLAKLIDDSFLSNKVLLRRQEEAAPARA